MIIGTGVDIVEIHRIQRAIERFGPSFIRRVYTDGEAQTCMSSPGRQWERWAVRFAAKEAVLKALGTGVRHGIRWTDVEVVSNRLGKPDVVLHGEAKRVADRLGVRSVQLALSHAKEYAVATALCLADADQGTRPSAQPSGQLCERR